LAAGDGNITHGFNMTLTCYQMLYNAGIKNDAELAKLLSDTSRRKK